MSEQPAPAPAAIRINEILDDLEADVTAARAQEHQYETFAAEWRGRRLAAEAARDRLIARLQEQTPTTPPAEPPAKK